MSETIYICDKCKLEAHGFHRFWRHYAGAHLKNIGEEEKAKKREELFKQVSQSQILKDVEPEISDADEKLITEIGISTEESSCSKELELDLENYLSKGLFCREERQLVHLLLLELEKERKSPPANGARHFKKSVCTELGLQKDKILDVFFEVTIMRDFHKQKPVEFNKKLKAFINQVKNEDNWKDKLSECDTTDASITEVNHPNYWSKPNVLARWLVNAKPDFAVLESVDDNDISIKFFECKYESGIDTYVDPETGFSLGQLDVQNLIIEFLVHAKFKWGEKKIVSSKVKQLHFNKVANETGSHDFDFNIII